ncbi:DUF1080 domain-containing protein [Leadbetterella sp. DM7]|uniref:3-keto-disaccharide hydrolase n=1 Tax=Leadbetterella sp. DM7 TaxID=3235085 RepID=UPI00349ED9DA
MIKKLVVLALLVSTQGMAQEWKSLFNGKDLTGWKQLGGKAVYKVEDGAIVGYTVNNTPNSFLVTQEEYGDFVFEVDVFLSDPMNSGIQFRSLSAPDYENGRVHGYQMEIDPSDRGWSGGIYDEGRRDWLTFPEINPQVKTAFKMGQWNKYRIEAVGSQIRTFINGVPVSYLIDDMTPKGFIALQVHSIYAEMKEGMKIKWKNIRINTKNPRLTPPDNTPVVNLLTNHLSDQEKYQGYRLLFNGKDLSGWRSVYSNDLPGKRWSVKDGLLSVSPSDGSETGNDIVTTGKYKAFELVFDFKLSEGANSGVKYFVDEKYDSGGKSGIGLEYQILDDEKHPDARLGAAGNRTLASLYDLIPSDKLTSRFFGKKTDWKTGRIIVFPDNRVQHWLNGFKVLEYKRNDNIFKVLVARSKYKDFEGFGTAAEGPILLQDHGDLVQFKNIKIRELK